MDHLWNNYHTLHKRLTAIETYLDRTVENWRGDPEQPSEPTATVNPDMVGMPPPPPGPEGSPDVVDLTPSEPSQSADPPVDA